MIEINNFDVKKVNWKYSDIYQLSQYLSQSDLIQLSLTCSQFRNKLNSTIFRKLDLIKYGEVTNSKYDSKINFFMRTLKKIYPSRYRFVKHCLLLVPCSSSFAVKLYNTFSYVTKLELYSSIDNSRYVIFDTNNISNLISTLKPFNKLEILILDCKLISLSEDSGSSNFKLPTCLKVFNITGDLGYNLSFGPIENINEEYTGLKNVTIINNKMLANISNSINSLTEVVILNNSHFCCKTLTQLFSQNSQLKKISISLKFIEFNVINAILQLKKLDMLNIMYYKGAITSELKNLAINTSIKHLNISYDITQNILLPIILSMKSLHTLELSNYNFTNFCDINWSLYNIKFHLLHLNCAWNAYSDIYEFLNSGIFDKIRISNILDLEYYNEKYNFDKLENWKIFQIDPLVIDDFYLVRKNENLDE